MPQAQLVFGVNELGFVVLGMNDYDYCNDNTVITLLKQYKKVIFDDNFNSNIDWLPEGIIEVHLGKNFNQLLNNLPSTVKIIIIKQINGIGYTKFNQKIDNLPQDLEELYLYFNKEFNHTLTNLPIKLKKFLLHGYNYKETLNSIPNSLEEIIIKQFDYKNTYELPLNLKIITISEKQTYIENLNGNTDNNIENTYQHLKRLENKYPNIKFNYSG